MFVMSPQDDVRHDPGSHELRFLNDDTYLQRQINGEEASSNRSVAIRSPWPIIREWNRLQRFESGEPGQPATTVVASPLRMVVTAETEAQETAYLLMDVNTLIQSCTKQPIPVPGWPGKWIIRTYYAIHPPSFVINSNTNSIISFFSSAWRSEFHAAWSCMLDSMPSESARAHGCGGTKTSSSCPQAAGACHETVAGSGNENNHARKRHLIGRYVAFAGSGSCLRLHCRG